MISLSNKIVKHIFALLLALFMLFSFASFTLAAPPAVVDQAYLFTDSEINELNELINEIQSSVDINVVVVTTTDTDGKSAAAYADDFYDYNGYRYDGILILIDMQHREVFISTSGSTISTFTDARINSIHDKISPYMKKSDYFGAAKIFLERVKHYEFDEHGLLPWYQSAAITHIPVLLLISAIVALISVLIMAARNKSRMTATASDYLVKNSFNLTDKKDHFLHTHTTSVYRPPSNGGSSGGSSTRTGSSGRTHGGSGRRF